MPFPFEVEFEEIRRNPDQYVSSVFSCLESEFMSLPKGSGFVDYATFEVGYEALKKATRDFSDLAVERIVAAIAEVPVSMVVLRSILGFSPSEWAYVTTRQTRMEVKQGAARTLDRHARMFPLARMKVKPDTGKALEALVTTACALIQAGPESGGAHALHRLDKADTCDGIASVQNASRLGVPYAVLLYERFLGRPFASHRDSVSEIVGDVLEAAIEEELTKAGISFRKTKRAERIRGFDQAPDFIVPDEFDPKVVIEAKITEDDGTARDKATRIQHLGELSTSGQKPGDHRFEVIACLGGRGFAVRREDMKKILLATRGKVFTSKTLPFMVQHTKLREFRTK